MKTSNLKIFFFIILSCTVCSFGLHAADLTWDADTLTSGPQDGPGTWDTTTNTWWDGANNVTWDNVTPANAIFGGASSGTAGPVTIGASLTINVGNLTLNTPFAGNYNFTPGDANSSLSFIPSSVITIASGLIVTNTVVFTGSSSFTKAGAGTFWIRPATANLNTGTTIVTAGTLVMGSSGNRVVVPGDLIVTNTGDARLGAANTIANAATVSVSSGATFEMNGNGLAVSGFVLDGGTVSQSSTESLAVNNFDAQNGSIIQNSGATGKFDVNTLTKSTPGTVTLTSRGASAANGGITNTIVNDGTLILDYTQSSSKLNDSGTLTVNGGTLAFTNGSTTEVVGAVTIAGGVITNSGGTSKLSVTSPGSYDVRAGAVYTVLAGTAGLTKTTTDTVILGVINTYSGSTAVNDGTLLVNGAINGSGSVSVGADATLGGIGLIKGVITINAGGTLAPGTAPGSIGQLTNGTTLILSGNMVVDVNKSGSTLASDTIVGLNSVTFGGNLTVNATGDALVAGDNFKVFNMGGTGDFTSIIGSPGANLSWSFNHTTGVLSVISNGTTQPTLSVSQSGNTLMFSWTDASFKLQSQTNSLTTGLDGNWSDYPDGGTSPVNVTIDPANPTVFFRLSQ